MAMRHGLENLLAEPLPELDHPLLMAGGAEVAAFAREGKKVLVIAVLAFDAGEAVVEDTAIKIAVNHLLHIRTEEAVLGGEALVVGLLESLEMILDAQVIRGTLRLSGAVYWRDVGHLLG
jgi:hypothetical protein